MRRFFARLLSFFTKSRAEADLAREIETHLLLLEDRFRAQGMTAGEAHDAARRAFGGQVEQTKERQRDARSFRWMDQGWLDAKLAARMLVRYPGLTLVGVGGLAVAVAIASGTFAVLGEMLDSAIPLDEGDRVVSIQYWHAGRNQPERRVAHDLASWRDGLQSVSEVGAYQQVGRNLIVPGGVPQVVPVAEMTASGFRIARVPPLAGRYLLDDDERAGAAAVVVLGHDEWRTRFAGDPAIVGKTMQLGAVHYTIVGVMPAGFAFPVNHQFWVPLKVESAAYPPLEGPDLMVFGRLAPGTPRTAAQAELTTIGQRMSEAFPATHAQLRLHVVPYTYPFSDLDEPENAIALHTIQFLLTLLLGLVTVNVAILVYARTVTRHAEIAVRSALGASRRRVVTQLFVEALALSSVAALAGLGLVAYSLGALETALQPILGELPFWLDFRLTPAVVAYAIAFAVLAAAIIGIVPALKATGRRLQSPLQLLSAGAGAGMRLGPTWTALVVAQVAVAVALLPTAIYHAWDATRLDLADPGYAPAEFLRAQVTLDPSTVLSAPSDAAGREAYSARYADRLEELSRQLESQAGVHAVTWSITGPGEEGAAWVSVDGVDSPARADDYTVSAGNSLGHRVRLNRVDSAWLSALGVATLAGRALTRLDAAPGDAIVVSESFVRTILGGGQAVGRRLRFVGASGDVRADHVDLTRSLEIVGVVADFPAAANGRAVARVYQAVRPGEVDPAVLIVHLPGQEATAFAPTLRAVAASVDPDLQLRGVDRIDAPAQRDRSVFRMVAIGLVLVTLSVVALSAAGIYALMSCTVEQRRREIGIRTALGADPRRILAAIFARALTQLGIGAAIGMGVALLLDTASGGDLMAGHAPVIVPLVTSLMMTVGLVAAVGPARRGLRVHPIESLRAE